MMFVGTVCAAIDGAALPCMIVVFGGMIDLFTDTGKLKNFLEEIADFLNHTKITHEKLFKDTGILKYVF